MELSEKEMVMVMVTMPMNTSSILANNNPNFIRYILIVLLFLHQVVSNHNDRPCH